MNPLHLPAFRAYLALRFFMATGWHMQATVVAWRVYDLTKDPLTLGMVGLAEAIPAIGAALPMGYIVDKMEKRRAARIASMLIIVSAVATGLLVQPWCATALGTNTTVTAILSMIVLNGFARSIYSPAMFSTLGAVVPRDIMSRATATASGTWQAAMVTGPLLGGVIYGAFGVLTASIAIVVLMLLGAAGSIFLPRIPAVAGGERGRLRDDLTQGLRFIFKNPIIFGALSLDMFAVLFGGAVAVLPVFADVILHVDASGLGALRAAPSLGSVAMMAWLSVHPFERRVGHVLLFSIAGFGLATIAFALSHSFWLSLALLVLVGGFDAVSVVVRHTVLQLHTPEEMRGRVAAANTMFISSSNELGAVESGIAARFLGLVPSVVLGGCMTLIVVAVVAWKVPALRRLENFR
jgi:MFS family permease